MSQIFCSTSGQKNQVHPTTSTTISTMPSWLTRQRMRGETELLRIGNGLVARGANGDAYRAARILRCACVLRMRGLLLPGVHCGVTFVADSVPLVATPATSFLVCPL